MTATTPASSALVRPFTVAIADSEIDDLKQRLARTRWPGSQTVPNWSQGVRLENAKSLINYWEREYDWRRFESELNRFPQFLTAIDGLDIHFIHVKSKNPNAIPLRLTHAWPGSIVEFLKRNVGCSTLDKPRHESKTPTLVPTRTPAGHSLA
jgi:epoxide hydrolase